MALEIAIFDLDGCLYKKPPNEHNLSFYETRLGKKVADSILSLIVEVGSVTQDMAEDILAAAKQNPVGPSVALGAKYKLTRGDFFERTWGQVDTEGFVSEEDAATAQDVLTEVNRRNIRTILLTAGPSPWAKKILDELGVGQKFESLIFGEQYDHKVDVFKSIARTVKPETSISVGDDYMTDIVPALALGMHAYHIKEEQPLVRLIDVIEGL